MDKWIRHVDVGDWELNMIVAAITIIGWQPPDFFIVRLSLLSCLPISSFPSVSRTVIIALAPLHQIPRTRPP